MDGSANYSGLSIGSFAIRFPRLSLISTIGEV
jgi:hypothetical protein